MLSALYLAVTRGVKAKGTGRNGLGSDAPIAVGGVGGSGTRVVARVLQELGFFLGPDLNESLDNLWFTLLFKRVEMLGGRVGREEFRMLWQLFAVAMTGQASPAACGYDENLDELSVTGRPGHSCDWLNYRRVSLASSLKRALPTGVAWGWKEPNTHFVLDRLFGECKGLRYIHVMRNGLDMAYSTNQNQLETWGRFFLTADEWALPGEVRSLRFWRRVHERVFAIMQQADGQGLVVNFDELCLKPASELTKLFRFLGIKCSKEKTQELCRLVRPPASQGRHKLFAARRFDEDDVAYVQSLGFDVAR